MGGKNIIFPDTDREKIAHRQAPRHPGKPPCSVSMERQQQCTESSLQTEKFSRAFLFPEQM
ncbi:MAG: hypothetical protein KKA54_14905 [Proteobacteria bacterium]|nr:hypothetical protein [Pseudomonadota bacterium]MBU0967658.1 hypothetical protein [Pseudomonadota bacterium]